MGIATLNPSYELISTSGFAMVSSQDHFHSPKARVNTPPPEGGGFGLRLEAGLIDPLGRFSQTTLKLSSGSSGF